MALGTAKAEAKEMSTAAGAHADACGDTRRTYTANSVHMPGLLCNGTEGAFCLGRQWTHDELEAAKGNSMN